MATAPATILGGLPVIAVVSFGTDSWTGEGWAEVEAIHWAKRDGSKGAQIPQHLLDRAEKYDPYFCTVTEQVSDYLSGPPDPQMFQLTLTEGAAQ